MDHISRIEIFLEVVKKKSFAGAARKLGITGSAISKQVQTLEDQLGVILLHRTTRQVTLTEEGALYNERARKALEDLKEAESQIQDLKTHPKGLLKVGAPMAFGKKYLTKPIAEFAKKYPEVQMEVDFDDRRVDMILEGYDVIIRIGALQDSSFIARQLAKCPIILCASKDLLEKYGYPSSPAQLKNYPAIIYNTYNNTNEWNYKDSKDNIETVTLNRHFAANNAETMVEACLHGVGIVSIPIFAAAEYLDSGQLIQLLPDYTTYPERGIYAIFPQNRHLSTKTRLFIDALSECSKDFPW